MSTIRHLIFGLALATTTAVAFAQPPQDRDDHGHDDHGQDDRGHDNRGHDDHRGGDHGHQENWSRGHALPSEYRDRGHYVDDYRSHRLRQPPRGYRWVRTDNNYVLVAITTGIIADIVAQQY
jgi:Ni/Co efflux regulator RcnB